jgi:hypothetical protein
MERFVLTKEKQLFLFLAIVLSFFTMKQLIKRTAYLGKLFNENLDFKSFQRRRSVAKFCIRLAEKRWWELTT